MKLFDNFFDTAWNQLFAKKIQEKTKGSYQKIENQIGKHHHKANLGRQISNLLGKK